MKTGDVILVPHAKWLSCPNCGSSQIDINKTDRVGTSHTTYERIECHECDKFTEYGGDE